MKITIAWNVWDNHDDVLLGSEIVRHDNRINSVFDKVELISQGGYDIPPSITQQKYLDQYYHIEAQKDLYMLEKHSKYTGVYRVLDGIKNAYHHALKSNSDYAVITNGDAWLFDLVKLKGLLNRSDVVESAISARVGKMTGMLLNYGKYVPFFDDHFLVLNVKLCNKYSVFDYDIPKSYNAIFAEFGGIHYILGCLMDERAPKDMLNFYTDMSDCVNHCGSFSGLSLLPLQYQPSFGFLHANCQQEENLHPLRAKYIEHFGFSKLTECQKYCDLYLTHSTNIGVKNGIPIMKENALDVVKLWFLDGMNRFYTFMLERIFYRRVLQLDKTLHFSSVGEFKKSSHILPISLVSRRVR